MSTFTKELFAAFLISALIPGCGAKTVEEETTESTSTKVATDRPADSTGTLSPLNLTFNQAASAALRLEAATVLDLGGGVKVTEAKFAIGSIKIKANETESEDENSLEDLMKAEKEKLKATIEADEEAWEAAYEEEKKTYEEQKEQAQTDAEKDSAEAAWEVRKNALEVEKAAIEATVESALDALEAENDGNLRWQGPYVYDAVTGALDKDLPEISVLDGSYERIEFKIKPYRDGVSGDPMLNRSIIIKGTVLVGATEVPFVFSSKKDEELKLKGAGSMAVEPGTTNPMQVAFNIQAGFAGVDLTSLAVDAATGSILIDELNNADVMETIVKAIKKSVRFGLDSDGDGSLGDDEEAGDGEEGVVEEEDEDESESET